MKKIALIVFIITLTPTLLKSQSIDDIVKRNITPIAETAVSCSELYTLYMLENKIDSASYIIEYWKEKCGMSEPVFRAEILLMLLNDTFKEDSIDKDAGRFIDSYMDRSEYSIAGLTYLFDQYNFYFGYIPFDTGFDRFTRDYAAILKNNFPEKSIEYCFCIFYEGNFDTFFSYIMEDDSLSNSTIAEKFRSDYKKNNSIPAWHSEFYAGCWIPNGDLSILGVHPELGYQFGVKTGKFNWDIDMAVRFLKSANTYNYVDKFGEANTSNHYLGAHIGFDIGYDAYRKTNNEIQFIAGIAYDGFDIIKTDDKNEIKGYSTGHVDYNLGIGYRNYFGQDDSYWGLRLKYHIADYTKDKIIGYKGNAVSIQLSIGGLANAFKNRKMERYRYYRR